MSQGIHPCHIHRVSMSLFASASTERHFVCIAIGPGKASVVPVWETVKAVLRQNTIISAEKLPSCTKIATQQNFSLEPDSVKCSHDKDRLDMKL